MFFSESSVSLGCINRRFLTVSFLAGHFFSSEADCANKRDERSSVSAAARNDPLSVFANATQP